MADPSQQVQRKHSLQYSSYQSSQRQHQHQLQLQLQQQQQQQQDPHKLRRSVSLAQYKTPHTTSQSSSHPTTTLPRESSEPELRTHNGLSYHLANLAEHADNDHPQLLVIPPEGGAARPDSISLFSAASHSTASLPVHPPANAHTALPAQGKRPSLALRSQTTASRFNSLRNSTGFRLSRNNSSSTSASMDNLSPRPESAKRLSDELKAKKKSSFSISSLFKSPGRPTISAPENPVHITHVGVDNRTGEFTVCKDKHAPLLHTLTTLSRVFPANGRTSWPTPASRSKNRNGTPKLLLTL
jgi:hypothetical protein